MPVYIHIYIHILHAYKTQFAHTAHMQARGGPIYIYIYIYIYIHTHIHCTMHAYRTRLAHTAHMQTRAGLLSLSLSTYTHTYIHTCKQCTHTGQDLLIQRTCKHVEDLSRLGLRTLVLAFKEVGLYVCMYLFMYVCMYVCMYVYVYIMYVCTVCMYTCIHRKRTETK